jgi:short subunit dehydrogenase-like uncharacterized protein
VDVGAGSHDVGMSPQAKVMVYGATGHTGRFVVAELLARGLEPILAGRSARRLAEVGGPRGLEQRVLVLDDPDRLRRGLEGVGAVVSCAGPFIDTGPPLARAAVAVGAHYLDVTAEQQAVRALYDELDGPARDAGVVLVPAMAFYGGFADLLVSSLVPDDDRRADEVEVAIGLDRWWPTAGTRATGDRNTATRLVVRGGELAPLADPAPTGTWDYPPPLGTQAVVELPLSEVMTITRHVQVGRLTSYLNSAPLEDLHDADTPGPTAVDADGRSAQRFVVDVVVRRDGSTRHARAAGRDIYAVSAPILVEGVTRLLEGRHHGPGALAPGQAFDAADVLAALERRTGDLVLTTDESVRTHRDG